MRKSKSISSYKKRLWKIFSEYIRRKYADDDGYEACVTCGDVAHWKEMDAGHYHPKTDGTSIYFEEKNVHPQCTGCNRFRRGNLTRYALFLQRKYGVGILEELDAQRKRILQLREPQYLELIAEYQEKLKALEMRGSI